MRRGVGSYQGIVRLPVALAGVVGGWGWVAFF